MGAGGGGGGVGESISQDDRSGVRSVPRPSL